MQAVEQVFNQTNWSGIDWAILAVYMAASLAIGLWLRGRSGSLSTFLVAGRGVGVYLGIATLVATELGLVTVMYMGQAGFQGGFSAYFFGVLGLVTTLAVGLTGFVVSGLRRAEVMTIPEFYEKRYNKTVRVVGASILAISGILNYAVFLVIDAQFISAVLGLGDGMELKLVMTVMLAIVLLYTVAGGMVSVIMTDLVQFSVMGLGLLAATYVVVLNTGWDRMIDAVYTHRGLEGFDPAISPEFGPAWFMVVLFGNVAGVCLWMPSTVRAMCSTDATVARKVYLWSSVGYMARMILPVTWGIAAYVYVINSPDLRETFFPAGGGSGLDTAYGLPIYLSRALPVGLLGLVMAGMLAASMSTHSSYLMAWSSVIAHDIVGQLRRGGLSDAARVRTTRIAVLVIGLFVLTWGVLYPIGTSIWQYMAFTAIIYMAGAFVVVVAGLHWRRASPAGAALALAAGLLATLSLHTWDRSDYPVRVTMKDAAHRSVSADLVLTVTPPEKLGITVPVLPRAVRRVLYRGQISVSGAGDPLSFAVVAPSSLPDGLTLDVRSGEIVGAPERSGTFSFTVSVTSGNEVVERELVLPIDEPPVASGSLPLAFVGESYRAQLELLGAAGPVRWSLDSTSRDNRLPQGFRLEGSELVGTAVAPGSNILTLRAETDGKTVIQAFTLHAVEPGPAIVTRALPYAPAGKAYSFMLEARRTVEPVAWTVEGDFPEGIRFDGRQFIGTPTQRFPLAFLSGAALPLFTILASAVSMVVGSLLFPGGKR